MVDISVRPGSVVHAGERLAVEDVTRIREQRRVEAVEQSARSAHATHADGFPTVSGSVL
jgi:hypothetical protein